MGPRLRRLSSVVALFALAAFTARAQTSDQILENYIELAQFASPYAGGQRPEQWCKYTRTDLGYSWWYFNDPQTGILTPLRTQSAFGIPFTVSDYNGVKARAAIVVGYLVDRGPPKAPLVPISLSTTAPDCSVGLRVLTNGPLLIDGLAKDIASQTAADPAPEYRMWLTAERYRSVRLISSIPVSFQASSGSLAGRLLIGFTGNW